MYELWHDGSGKCLGVHRPSTGSWIPQNPLLRDWREFLAWNAEQPAPLVLADRAPNPPAPTPPTEAEWYARLDSQDKMRRALAKVLVRLAEG